jgi:CheY-like chemotaxis protein
VAVTWCRDILSPADVKGPKILIVDDDGFQLKLTAKLLTNAFHSVSLSYAHSGTEALEKLNTDTDRPDLILMDIKMPDISGIEVTEQIIKNKALCKIPVVMVTGNSRKSMVIKSLQAGARDFVVKPLQAKKLIPKVKKWVKGLGQ